MLPITEIKNEILAALRSGNRLVITAPTGTGKSTQVPQYLLDCAALPGQILVLQPRRLAARMLAARVADERGTQPGGEIGFQTRFESAVSASTRVRFITEGILPRLLLEDAALAGISAVVFDEFHERSLTCDLSLALLKALQERQRPDLKLVVMSATLETRELLDYLAGAKLVAAEARRFPVEFKYLPAPLRGGVWDPAALALRELLATERTGDVLMFMPGLYEIRRTIEACRATCHGHNLLFLPLYGDLPAEQQNAVMRPAGQRRVIVATNIAETSLTVPGVRHVIDAGLARVNRYDAGRGFNTLFIEPISRHAADQRAGRAGREAPGTCVRLWTQLEQNHRTLQTVPEVKRVDLAEALLQIRTLGFADLAAFPWFEAPAPQMAAAATALLAELGAVTADGRALTSLGRQMAEFPAHPRLARLLLDAAGRGCLREACTVAALLSERPILLSGTKADDEWQERVEKAVTPGPGKGTKPVSSPPGQPEAAPVSDFTALMDVLHLARRAHFDRDACARYAVNGAAAAQVFRTDAFFLQYCRRRHLPVNHTAGQLTDLVKALLLAFPDHLARRRDHGSLVCELRDGRHGELTRASAARGAPLVLPGEIREVGGGGQGPRILLSMNSEVRIEWLQELFPDSWKREEIVRWNEDRKQAECCRRTLCLGLLLEEKVSWDVPAAKVGPILATQILEKKLPLLGLNEDAENWMLRVRWVAEQFPDRGLIVYTPEDIAVVVHELCTGKRRYDEVRDVPLQPLLRNLLSWDDQQFIERMAPDHIQLPSGRRMRLRYRPGHPPRGNSKLQDLYDVRQTPMVAGGRVKVLLEILAPNMRPVQITDDLAGFWENRYPAVKKELSRRYPRHEWR